MKAAGAVPETAAQAVLVPSEQLPEDAVTIRGYDFNQGCDLNGLLESMLRTGLQATALGQAINEVNRMIRWRLSDEPLAAEDEPHPDPAFRAATRCKIFLGYTSNLVSAGVREHVRYLVQHRMVDVIVTTAGGVEEDYIKCMAPTFVGDFQLKGADLRKRGLNRIGNMLVPNSNYCKFEDWVIPIFDAMLEEQQSQGVLWTPSKMIARLGKEINHPDSIYYWAWKNGIPVFCPALTDGSLGDMLFFHTYKNPGLVLDIVQDIRAMNDHAMKAAPRKTGAIILGGGVPKHHICNANLMKNGADFAVFVNTAQEFDGSDSGARPDEAVSWGKIRADAQPVKVCGDASILFPLIISQTFARHWEPQLPLEWQPAGEGQQQQAQQEQQQQPPQQAQQQANGSAVQ
ncbi:Deoxyhypusine synthase [Chlorella sorokiniana]|uniref:Deoxyhypusine synthase n=1 Tax=Chlorella sorokiniana TaxID=3076 RepID=A0A2P6TQF9_CHLSO|nr:Deoxyhypusine synthase [Chlorella sorokiniana]|eukprot:PRW56270.1 Deoxyhypusine synthase [Chlorella sorokiniana]